MYQIRWCYHSNESSSVVLSHGTIYLVWSSNVWVWGWYPKVRPFYWNLFRSSSVTFLVLFISLVFYNIYFSIFFLLPGTFKSEWSMTLNCFSIPYSRLIGRPSSVIFRLSELAHRVEECAQKEEEEEEELPEVRPFIISTYKFSWVISIHLLTESVERIWRKIKTFTLDDHLSNSHNISSSWCFYTVRRILMLIFF